VAPTTCEPAALPNVPSFAELPVRADAPPGSSWGVFGEADEIGTLNFITEAQIRAAAELVKAGTVLPLNLSVQEPDPAFFHRSSPIKHTIVLNGGESIDDY